MFLEVVAIALEEVGGFLDLSERFHAVLAHLERDGRADVVDAVLDELSHATQQPVAFFHRRSAPARECSPGRGNRLVDLLFRRHGKVPQDPVRVYRAPILDERIRANVLTVDEVSVRLAEIAAHILDGGLELLVQLGRRVEHSGIRQPE